MRLTVIYEVKHDLALVIDGVVVEPVANNNLQFLSLVAYETSELPAVFETCRVQVYKEVYDCREEVLGGIGEERLRAAFLLTAALVQ